MLSFRCFFLIAFFLAGTIAALAQSESKGSLGSTQSLVPRRSEQPSFDCEKAKAAAARLICADEELARLDAELGAAFKNFKSQIPEAGRPSVIAAQVAWIRQGNTRCRLDESQSAPLEVLAESKLCMLDAIRGRIAALALGAAYSSQQSPAAERGAQVAFTKPPEQRQVDSGLKVFQEAARDLDTQLREKPWMEGYLRALGANPRTGPMPPLTPAETRCKQVVDRAASRTPEEFEQDLVRCKIDLQQEWTAARADEQTALQNEPPIALGPAGERYHSHFLMAGLLLRAGKVCSNDPKRTIDAAFGVLGASGHKRMSEAYPDTTKRWMMEGADTLNAEVMSDGIDKACAHAERARDRAEGIAKN